MILLIIALGGSLLLGVTFGSVRISAADVYRAMAGRIGFSGLKIPSKAMQDVVWLIRLPRLALAAGIGAALSVSGLVIQAAVRNPLADPYILGVSAGSYTGAAAAIMLGWGSGFGGNAPGFMAFFGAFAASLGVLGLAGAGGSPTPVKLVLAGTVVNALCAGAANFMIFRSHDAYSVQAVIHWTMGSLARAEWPVNAVVLPVILVSMLFFMSQFRTLNLMLLGDEAAVSLGVELRFRRIIYLMVSAMMVGVAVFSAGMIGFVGLVIPHGTRILFGNDHRKLVILCGLIGAIFLIWADVLCRVVIAGAEMPIGILTSLVGAPCFAGLMIRRRYRFGGAV
ncbi:MAG: iron ABC transporter permease [Spirochaetaceae bacterium]|nr:iron ABC transporter permease [Spirochaetaceae bacterium]